MISQSYPQFKSLRGAGELNSQKRDKFFLSIQGLDLVDFDTKSMTECLERFAVGATAGLQDGGNYAKCAGEDKDLGW